MKPTWILATCALLLTLPPAQASEADALAKLKADNARLEARLAALEKLFQAREEKKAETKPSGKTKITDAKIEGVNGVKLKTDEHVPAVTKVKAETKIGDLEENFRVPTSPAATALGLNPDTLAKAEVPKELNIININGVDLRGNEQTGLAADIAVGQLFNLRTLGAKDYARGSSGIFTTEGDEFGYYLRRVITRTQLSIAGARGTGDEDKSIRLAIGLNIPLLVSNDPIQIGAEKGEVRSADTLNGHKLLDRPFSLPYFGALGNSLFNYLDWTVGGYAVAAAERSGSEHFRYGGSVFTSVWRFALEKADESREAGEKRSSYLQYMKLLAGVTYRDHELVPLSSVDKKATGAARGSLLAQDSLTLGGGLQVGKEKLHATLFYEYLLLDDETGNDNDASRYGVAVEFNVPNTNLYLTATAGEELGDGKRPNNSFVLGGVKIGLGGDSFKRPLGN